MARLAPLISVTWPSLYDRYGLDLGFRPLRRLPAVTFYVGPDGRRCHPGVGPNPHRRRLPVAVQDALMAAVPAEGQGSREAAEAAAEAFLATHGYYPIRDAGAERHLLVLNPLDALAPADAAARDIGT